MLPLFLVYIAEYTINLTLAPTLLLFPLSPPTPFHSHASFYPTYALLYQTGVFISRSSLPWVRLHNLYLPSLLQILNLALLTAQTLNWDIIPNVWIVFAIVLWEGCLGGAVYVNTFAEISEAVPAKEREFCLSAVSVSDSGGILLAGFVGLASEGALCRWQVTRGRSWCEGL